MRIEQLRYFKEICKSQSLNKAAEQLYISQPALSKNMQAMEQELGCTLLIREQKGISLTKAGKSFLTDVESILNIYDGALQKINNTLSFSAPLIIFSLQCIANSFSSILLESMRTNFSNLELHFNDLYSEDLSILKSAPNSLALTILETGVDTFLASNPDFICIPIKQEHIYTFMSKSTLATNVSGIISSSTNNIAFRDYSKSSVVSYQDVSTSYSSNTNLCQELILNQSYIQYLPFSLGKIFYSHPDIIAVPQDIPEIATYCLVVSKKLLVSEYTPVIDHLILHFKQNLFFEK